MPSKRRTNRNNRGRSNNPLRTTGHKGHGLSILPDLAPVDYFDKPEKPKKVITLPTLKFLEEKDE